MLKLLACRCYTLTARIFQKEVGPQFITNDNLLDLDQTHYEDFLKDEFSCCTTADHAELVVAWDPQCQGFVSYKQGSDPTNFALPAIVPTNRFQAVVWTTKNALIQWARNPCILIFDDTFNTDREHRFVFSVIGVDSNHRNSPLIRAFLDDAMVYRKLGQRLTKSVFRNAIHRICVWHSVWLPLDKL